MPGWDLLVDALRQLLFAVAHHMDGSLGASIAVIGAAGRVLLLPLTVRAALAARDHQAHVLQLKPQLDALKTRYAGKPGELAAQTAALYKRHDITALPKGTIITALVQIPLGAALYQAVRTLLTAGTRFLWVGDLTRPDWALTALTGALAALGVGLTGATQPAGASPAGVSTYAMAVVSGLLTIFFAFKLASGIGIYWAASSAVGVLQPVLVGRIARNGHRSNSGIDLPQSYFVLQLLQVLRTKVVFVHTALPERQQSRRVRVDFHLRPPPKSQDTCASLAAPSSAHWPSRRLPLTPRKRS